MIVRLPPGEFIDLYDATGITIGVQIEAMNITPNDVSLFATTNIPDASNDDHIPLLFGHDIATNESGDTGAWAISVGGGAVDVKVVS